MKRGGYPCVYVRGFLSRRKVTLYEDYLGSEILGIFGMYDIDRQIYYDEIHYVFRYRRRDWAWLIYMVLAVLLALFGLAVAVIEEPGALYIGLVIAGPSALWTIYCLIRLAGKRLSARVVSIRGTVDFWVNRPNSGNRPGDAPGFLETLLSRLKIVETADPPPPAADAPQAAPADPAGPAVTP